MEIHGFAIGPMFFLTNPSQLVKLEDGGGIPKWPYDFEVVALLYFIRRTWKLLAIFFSVD